VLKYDRRVSALLAFLSILAGACGSGSKSLPLNVIFRTLEDSVILHRTPTATYFDVTAIARNADSRQIEVAACGTEAQRDIDGTWTTVFTPVCSSEGITPLAPGDSLIIPTHVAGYTTAYPALDPRMIPGRYRLRIGVFLRDSQNSTSTWVSQTQGSTPFTVK
jgi:hypothetical protein